ncbi:MAG: lytic transglycosylase domain-containing protein [Actinobacteria bacterium]|nr:lytic transglycosylase domain-containing protein [Actinomycetota bacterium]
MVRVAWSLLAGFGLLLGLPVVAGLAAVGSIDTPSQDAVDEVPSAFLALYQDAVATRCPSLPWSVLAAIGGIESDHGRSGGAQLLPDGRVMPPVLGPVLDGTDGTRVVLDTDQGHHDGDAVFDRAVGPMQFIPATWQAYGVDASGDRITDPHNAVDAAHAAAVYLCASGATDPPRLPDAIWAYNNSWDYVERVMTLAARYSSAGSPGFVTASPTLVAMVLANPRLEIYDAGRADIAAGRIDARVLQVLQLASERHTLTITSLRTGHSRCVGGGDFDGCRTSHHWYGRAADIAVVDDRPVHTTNQLARGLVEWLAALDSGLRPTEIGTPWADLGVAPFFSDSDHRDHVHLGYRSNPG